MPPPEMQQRGSIIASPSFPPTSPPFTADDPDDAHTTTPSALPPWVHVHAPHAPRASEDAQALLPARPHPVQPDPRHARPPPAHYKPGRKWDHLRSPSPPLLSQPIADSQARWRGFMYAGPNSLEQAQGARVVDAAWMEQNMPVGQLAWRAEDEVRAEGPAAGLDVWSGQGLMYKGRWLVSPERQERTVRLFWRLLLKNPFVPLALRLMILAFATSSLAIAAKIAKDVRQVNGDGDAANQCSTRASTYMAVCVGSIAIPWLGWVTWDEYMSKPLGLRSASTKTLLLLCDLFFVVFSSSNLSLAFDALYDHRWACFDEQYEVIRNAGDGANATLSPVYNVPATCPNNAGICNRQKALSAILVISLIAWLTTFSLSVMRVVEKLRPD
ncbi:hypothetical protein LTR08_001364 [Meristemomyces frigidus]|nr:hypothetical protein LTR08_001364 [Meristemomyces frigidus]